MTTERAAQRRPARPSWHARLRACGPRDLALQLALVLLLAAFAAFLASNLAANAARLNLHLGFGFLVKPAGFDIAQAPIGYPENATYLRAFLVALVNTVLLAAVAILCSTLLGFLVGLARLSSNPLLSIVALGYVEMVRNIPLLLQLFFWYFAVLGPLPGPRQSLGALGIVFLNKRGLSLPAPIGQPDFIAFTVVAACSLAAAGCCLRLARRHRVRSGQASPKLWGAAAACLLAPAAVAVFGGSPIAWDVPRLSGFNLSGGIAIIPEFVAMALGLSIYGSAFVAELIRGGVATVGRGQTEAGLALGLSRWRVYRKIVIPQALRAVIPPLSGQYIHLLKNSSLASAIGYPDLMLIFAGTALNQTSQPLEIMAMTMASYLLLSLLISGIGNSVNRRMQLVER